VITNADGSAWKPGNPLPPSQGGGVPVPNEVASPTLATPYSDQISLGYAWQATNSIGLDFSLVSIDYNDIPFRFRANPVDPATGQRRFPGFGSFRMWYGGGKGSYDAANFGIRSRMDKLDLQGFYTYSRAKGNVLAGNDEFRITDRTYESGMTPIRDQSPNPYDPLCGACTGYLNTDARHKLTLAATYAAPFVQVSGMFRYRSATPYTVWTNTDPNHDGYRFDLLPGDEVNSKRGSSFSQFDMRLSHDFRFGGDAGVDLLVECFNLFNNVNSWKYGPVFDANGNPTGITPALHAGDPLASEQRLIQIGLRAHF